MTQCLISLLFYRSEELEVALHRAEEDKGTLLDYVEVSLLLGLLSDVAW